MRRLKVLTWRTHGSYLYYLTQAPHDFYVVSKPGRPPGYAGVTGHLPWGANVHDLPASEIGRQPLDCRAERLRCVAPAAGHYATSLPRSATFTRRSSPLARSRELRIRGERG